MSRLRTSLLAPLAALLTFALWPSPAGAAPLAQDGLTARIILNHGVGDLAFTSANGNYEVFVIIYQKTGDLWNQVEMDASLRVFTWGDHEVTANANPTPLTVTASASINAAWEDKALVPFTSDPAVPVAVSFPASALANTPNHPTAFDLFVTFSEVGTPEGTPTSHHSIPKNRALQAGLFDVADALDHDAVTYPVAL